jgi:hypothetical protein
VDDAMNHRIRWVLAAAALSSLQVSHAAAQGNAGGGPLPGAAEIVNRHVAAIGGRDALLKLRSRYVLARIEWVGQPARGTVELYSARPNKRVLDVSHPDEGTERTGFDGTVGWRREGGRPASAIRDDELKQLRDDAAFDVDLHDPVDVRAMSTVGVARWNGCDCYQVRITSVSGRVWDEYFDRTSGLLHGSEAKRVTEAGPVTVRTIISQRATYDGVKLPSVIRIRWVGGVEEVIRVQQVRHNEVDARIFESPLRP